MANRHHPLTSRSKMTWRWSWEEGFKIFTQTGLVSYYMASRMRKRNRSAPCPYGNIHPLALPHDYQCSNQYEHIHSESELEKHVDSRIYIIESIKQTSSKKDLNQFEIWKKDKYTMCLKCQFMKIWLKIEKWQNLKKIVFTGVFHL